MFRLTAVLFFFLFSFATEFHAKCYSDTLYPALKNGKWGYINQKGKVVIPFKYDAAKLFFQDRAIVKSDTLYGIINRNGKYIVKPQYWLLIYEGNSVYFARAGKNKFSIFSNNSLLSWDENNISYISSPYEGLMFFRDTQKRWGVLDSTGRFIVQPEYEDFRPFHEHRASVKKNGKWGYIDDKGKLITPCIYNEVEHYFWSGLSAVKNDSGWFVIDSAGSRISSLLFNSVTYRCRSFVGGTANGKTLFINSSGDLLFHSEFDSTAAVFVEINESFIPVCLNGKWGYVDHKGKWLIEPRFEEADGFYENWADVRLNGRSGIIGTDGHFIVAPRYDFCSWLYSSGIVSIRNDDRLTYTLIDTTGKQIIPFDITRFYYYPEDHVIWAVVDDHWVLYDESGNQRSIPQYYWGEPIGYLMPCFTDFPDDRSGDHPLGYFNRRGELIRKPVK